MRAAPKHVLEIVGFAAVYVVTATFGFGVDRVGGFATLIWVPSGLSLALVLLVGPRVWPGIAIGAFVANWFAGASLPAAVAIAAGNTLEALTAWFLLKRVGFRPTLDRLRDVFALTVFAAGTSTTVSATIGLAALELTGTLPSQDVPGTWAVWWAGNFSSDVIIAPLLLTLASKAPAPTFLVPVRWREVAGIMVALGLVASAVFFSSSISVRTLPWRNVIFVLTTWAAVRLGPRGAAVGSFVVCATAVSATAFGRGPFNGTAHDRFVGVESFVFFSAFTTLAIAAIAVERSVARAEAHKSSLEKAAILDAAPDAVVTADQDGTIRDFNGAASTLFRYAPSDVLGRSIADVLVPPRLRGRYAGALMRAARADAGEPSATRLTLALMRSDGTELPVDIAVTRTNAEGRSSFTAFIRDVTERQTAQDRLSAAVAERTAELQTAMADLAEREERLRQAEATAHVGSLEWNVTEGRVTGSEELYRILGLDPAAPVALETFLERIHPDDRASFAGDGPPRRDLRMIRADDGSERIVESVVAPRHDASGRVVRILCTFQDVTERRTTEQSQAALAALVEASTDAIVWKTPTGVIHTWNRGAERMYGYSRDEALGRGSDLLHPPEYVQDVLGFIARAARGEEVSFESCGKNRAGHVFHVAVTMSPIRDRGHVIGIATITRDISVLKNVEAKLQAFVEAIPIATMSVDRDGHIALANSATEQLFGYTRAELATMTLETLMPPSSRQWMTELRLEHLRDPGRVTRGAAWIDVVARRADGREFPIELDIAPIATEDGYLLVAIRDISRRLEMEEKVLASLREKEVLLREIHHRVKNNLQVIASLLRLQSAGVRDSEELRIFEESQGRIQSIALVHQLLYQSKDLANVDFGQYLERLLRRLVESYGATSRIALTVESPRGASVDIDAAVPCGLILNELVANAIKHAFPGNRHGRIDVRLERDDRGQVSLSVADDGVGFPRHEVDLGRTQTLGLQIVRALVKQIHGTVEASSSPQGSVIVLRFPTATAERRPAA